MPEINLPRLDQSFERMSSYSQRDSRLDVLFRDLILTAPDVALIRINPYDLATQWLVDANAVLLWLLYSSQIGLFDLNWESHCPHCTGTSASALRLGAVRMQGECKMCQTTFDIHSDENIEVTFSVNNAIRAARPSFENYLTYNEKFLGAFDTSAPITLQLERPGKYFLFSMQGSKIGGVFRVDVEHDYAPLTEAQAAFYPESAVPARVNAGIGQLTVHAEGMPRVFGMYRDDYLAHPSVERVTALKTMLLPQFKEIFADGLLSQRESLSVKNLTLMFTDITGSTAMYKRLGDVRAYNLVRDHFEVLFREITANNGVVVKTIGDAVMAAFASADHAVRAALEVQRGIRAFNQGRDPEQGVILVKIGLHSGSVIAVNLNNTIDYFGNMVNMAARIQSKSRSEEILLSDAVYCDPGVQKLLAADTRVIVMDSVFDLHGIGDQRLYSVSTQPNL